MGYNWVGCHISVGDIWRTDFTSESIMSKPTFKINDVINNLKIIEDLGVKKGSEASKNSVRFVMVECIKCGNKIEGRYQKFKDKLKVCPCSSLRKIKKFTCPYRLRILKIWHGMRTRCYNKSSKSYGRYGGKGILICDEWLSSFDDFYRWSIKNGYGCNLSIDRIESNLGYAPNNCRWADAKMQSRNRRNTLKESQVIEIKNMIDNGIFPVEIAKKYNVPVKRIYYIKTGLTWNE